MFMQKDYTRFYCGSDGVRGEDGGWMRRKKNCSECQVRLWISVSYDGFEETTNL